MKEQILDFLEWADTNRNIVLTEYEYLGHGSWTVDVERLVEEFIEMQEEE